MNTNIIPYIGRRVRIVLHEEIAYLSISGQLFRCDVGAAHNSQLTYGLTDCGNGYCFFSDDNVLFVKESNNDIAIRLKGLTPQENML